MKNKDKIYSFRVDPVLDEQIREEAETHDLRISELIRNIVGSYFDRNWYKKLFK